MKNVQHLFRFFPIAYVALSIKVSTRSRGPYDGIRDGDRESSGSISVERDTQMSNADSMTPKAWIWKRCATGGESIPDVIPLQ